MAFYPAQIGETRSQNAFVVHPAVLEEPGIFNRQNGVFHDLRNLGDGCEVATFFAELAQQRPFR